MWTPTLMGAGPVLCELPGTPLPRRSCTRARRRARRGRAPSRTSSLLTSYPPLSPPLPCRQRWPQRPLAHCPGEGHQFGPQHTPPCGDRSSRYPLASGSGGVRRRGDEPRLPHRHKQAERGAQEGRTGQLYRPSPRDGALGYTRGHGVQLAVLACHRRSSFCGEGRDSSSRLPRSSRSSCPLATFSYPFYRAAFDGIARLGGAASTEGWSGGWRSTAGRLRGEVLPARVVLFDRRSLSPHT
jgi:hypothetical protein